MEKGGLIWHIEASVGRMESIWMRVLTSQRGGRAEVDDTSHT